MFCMRFGINDLIIMDVVMGTNEHTNVDNNKSIKVSVCIITYNQAEYVRQTIDSVLSQNVDIPIEILIADDASTDGTPEILKEYKRKYPDLIRLILRKKNLGANKNAYQILVAAKGEYICGLEGDDYWIDNNYIQSQAEFLDDHPEYIASSGRCIVGDKEGREITDLASIGNRKFWEFDKKEFSKEDFCEWKMPGHMSATFYRNFYKERDFDGSVLYKFHPMIGDRTTLLQLIVRGKIFCYDKAVLSYRFVDETTAHNWMAVSAKSNKRLEEYKLICVLENYARQKYDPEFNLTKLKKNKVAAAVSVAILDRTTSNAKVAIQIIMYDHHLIRNLIVALSTMIQKFYWIARGKSDHRVLV